MQSAGAALAASGGARVEGAFCLDWMMAINRESNQAIVFFFFTLVTGSRRSLSLKLSDTRVY
jgi:hypothetical protein